jgi:hypothetical protein
MSVLVIHVARPVGSKYCIWSPVAVMNCLPGESLESLMLRWNHKHGQPDHAIHYHAHDTLERDRVLSTMVEFSRQASSAGSC